MSAIPPPVYNLLELDDVNGASFTDGKYVRFDATASKFVGALLDLSAYVLTADFNTALSGKASIGANTFTGTQRVNNSNPAQPCAIYRAALGQGANIIDWRDNSDGMLGRIANDGSVFAPAVVSSNLLTPDGGGLNSNGLALPAGKEIYWPSLDIANTAPGVLRIMGYGAATETRLRYKRVAGQSSNVIEVIDENEVVLGGLGADGALRLKDTSSGTFYRLKVTGGVLGIEAV